ncbi:MAG: DUF58 domain-containing protein [candidate division KSB1 bacterium]|nr:DUF58 domain-containing protein [candidate division KSB1 bacterium]
MAVINPSQNYRKYLKPEVISRLASMDLRARLVVEGFITGLHRSPYHGFSVEFAEHRQYMPGDEIKHVDWKVYGKTDRYYVKEFEEETNLKAYLLLDASASMGYTSGKITKLEYASYLAAALTHLMLRQRDAVGLVIFDEAMRQYLPPRSVNSYLYVILRELERIQSGKKTNVGRTFHELAERIKRRGLIIVLSDLLAEPQDVLSGLKHFRHRNHEVIVFQILDPMEITFAFDHDAIFKDLETGEEISTQPWHIRGDYRQKVQAFIEKYKRDCRENRIDYVLMDTATDFDRALFEYLVKRKRIGG